MASPAKLPGATLSPTHRLPASSAGAELDGGWLGGGRRRDTGLAAGGKRHAHRSVRLVAGHARVAHSAHTRVRPNSASVRHIGSAT
eukprot:2422120-Pleurochrysis_carterae.AAC.3